MGLRTATAILLDVFDLAERDRIVAFLTAEHGQKRGVAKSARSKFSRFSGQLQPLAKAEVTWFEKEGRDLVRISEVSLVRSAVALQEDLEGILLGGYLAEHMAQFAQENEDSSRLFRLLDTTLEALLSGIDRSLAARYYEIWMLRLAGVFPVPRQCPLCSRKLLDRAVCLPADGALICADCARDEAEHGAIGERFEIGPRVLELLRRSARENLAELAGAPPDKGALERTEELCAQVRRAFLQDELRSYQMMRRTLASV